MTATRRSMIATILGRGTVFIVLIGLVIFFALTTEESRFIQPNNLTNILKQNAHVIVVAVGMTLTMLVGGIDLSVGSVAALTGAISAGLIVRDGWAVPAAIGAALAVGFLLGALNGGLVVFGKLPPFVATLAMLGIARGLTLVYTERKTIAGMGEEYTFWSRGEFGPIMLPGGGELAIPAPVVVWVFVLLLAWLLLTRTRFGLHIYAIGGNEETARLAGVPVNRVKILTYALSGMLAGLAGVLLTARVFSAQPQAAVGLELEAIAAAVLGGVSLFGGVGTVYGAVVGALIVGVLGNGMNLQRVAAYSQQVIQGVVLLLALTVDVLIKRLER